MTNGNGLSRRRFISAVASTAAGSCLPLAGAAILAGESTPALGQYSHVSSSVEVPDEPISVINAGYRLLVDSKSGSIAALAHHLLKITVADPIAAVQRTAHRMISPSKMTPLEL